MPVTARNNGLRAVAGDRGHHLRLNDGGFPQFPASLNCGKRTVPQVGVL